MESRIVLSKTIKVDKSEIDCAVEKANRLCELLKEANSLIDELTSKPLEITIHI
nr:MAG TPA: hypothetical protein [Caudoviricetes sp.]